MLPLILSLIAVLIIAVISSAFCHFFIKGNVPANVASVTYTILIFHGLAYIETGATDPNWLISSIIIAIVTVPIAMLTGKLIRKRKSKPV